MTTAKQTAANRRNAQRSTGPKTTAGKAASSRNALLLPGESRRAFRRLFRSFLAEYHPSGPLQEFLVEQLAIAYWKLSRLTRIEAHVYRQPPTTNTNLLRQLREALLARHDDDNDDHNGDPEPDPEPESPQPALTPDEAIARTYIRDSAGPNTLAHLSYYEMRLERTFFRAWRELHRLQAKSPPAS
jgi:hypothetical protein